MYYLLKIVLLLVSTISTIITFTTFLKFMNFISNIELIQVSSINLNNASSSMDIKKEYIDQYSHVAQALVVDVALLSTFIIQHSSLLLPLQDMISNSLGTSVLSRTLMNMFTSLSLQLLMNYWMPIPQVCLWAIDYEDRNWRYTFIGVHSLSWILIYVMLITLDITSFLGIKQVYYFITSRPSSTERPDLLNPLQKKMRHPSILGFTLIFWIYPNMRLDRLVLAVVWSLYMLLAWRPDTLVYNYVVQQQAVKKVF